jgi:hypothetical protein
MPPVDTWRKHNNLLWPIRQGPAEIHDNLQHSCEWNRWREEFVLERPSNETQSTSVAMKRWSVEHRAFTVETYFWKKTILSLWLSGYFVGISIFIGRTVFLVAILCCCGWETTKKRGLPQTVNVQEESLYLELLRTSNDYVRFLSQVLRLRECADNQGTPPHRHYIQEVNVVIKILSDKDNFSNKFT